MLIVSKVIDLYRGDIFAVKQPYNNYLKIYINKLFLALDYFHVYFLMWVGTGLPPINMCEVFLRRSLKALLVLVHSNR